MHSAQNLQREMIELQCCVSSKCLRPTERAREVALHHPGKA
jgi:hypothetical protein